MERGPTPTAAFSIARSTMTVSEPRVHVFAFDSPHAGSCPYGAALLRAMQDDSRGPLHPYYIEDLLHFFADDGTWVAAIPNDIILFALAQLLLPSSDGGERYQKRADPALVNVPDPIGKKAPNASFHFMVLKQLIDTLVNCARPPEAKSLLADKQIPALVSDTLSAMVHNKGTYTLGQYCKRRYVLSTHGCVEQFSSWPSASCASATASS